MNLLQRIFPKPKENGGISDVMRHSKQWQRDLTAKECKKVQQVQAWATRQRNRIYDELNPAVKEARQ